MDRHFPILGLGACCSYFFYWQCQCFFFLPLAMRFESLCRSPLWQVSTRTRQSLYAAPSLGISTHYNKRYHFCCHVPFIFILRDRVTIAEAIDSVCCGFQ